MSEQLRLPGTESPYQVQPDPGRTEPVLWVRRLVVLRQLQPGVEHVVRDVKLRRGLNVVWAPPQPPPGGNALFASGVSGHTAGKTTFCRLIRYALGEKTFAAEPIRSRIRRQFPTGWVMAEVMVAGEPWVVARPFAIGPHPFCVRAESLENALEAEERLDYEQFLGALNGALTADLPAKRFPATDLPVLWDHVLPWLARDQECRFADPLEWRHSTSQSEAPMLAADERQFVVRSVLGLISDHERLEQQVNARLVAQKKEAAHFGPLLAHQASVDRRRVAEILGSDPSVVATELFASEARTRVDQRRREIGAELEALALSDRRPGLQQTVDHAFAAEVNAQRDVSDGEGRLAIERGALESLEQEVRTDGQVRLIAALPVGGDYCNVPLQMARERQCPLAVGRPVDLAGRRGERVAADELVTQRQVVESLEAAVASARSALAAAASATRDARRDLLAASTAFEQQRTTLLERRAELVRADRLARDAESAWEESARHQAALTTLDGQIEASYARQEQLRDASRQALARFSQAFDFVARALLGGELEGSVDTSGRSLSIVIDYRGERESAALATIKLLAFDLAALTSSVQGEGSFPRFLLHDGPREADMAREIYERLFLFARELEDRFAGEPSFQYIVATTTPPPAELLTAPWLRLELEGTPAENRLLRVDL